MSVACYTSFTFSYLAKARVLAKSVKRQHPNWQMIALITDVPPAELNFCHQTEPFDDIKYSTDLNVPNVQQWLFNHNVVEACTAVKGPFMVELLERGYEKVLYLDPDTVVFSSLEGLLNELDKSDILLTPHQLAPESTELAIMDNEMASLKWGTYNLGFVGVANRTDGRKFANWWSDRLLQYCYDNVADGIFVDQRWCNLVPAYFDNVSIVRDPGCNVASWNLSNRTVAIDDTGTINVNDSTLKFFHFTKLGELGDAMTERYAGENKEVYEIWAWYKRQVEFCTDDSIPKGYWHFGTFENGKKISQKSRVLYRTRGDLRAAFKDPYSSADPSKDYYLWLESNSPENLN